MKGEGMRNLTKMQLSQIIELGFWGTEIGNEDMKYFSFMKFQGDNTQINFNSSKKKIEKYHIRNSSNIRTNKKSYQYNGFERYKIIENNIKENLNSKEKNENKKVENEKKRNFIEKKELILSKEDKKLNEIFRDVNTYAKILKVKKLK